MDNAVPRKLKLLNENNNVSHEIPTLFVRFSIIRTDTLSQTAYGGRDLFRFTNFRSHSITKRSQSRNSKHKELEAATEKMVKQGCCLVTTVLSPSLFCFLNHPKSTYPAAARSKMGWALWHHTSRKKSPTGVPTGQSYGNFLNCVILLSDDSRSCQVGKKLASTSSYEIW